MARGCCLILVAAWGGCTFSVDPVAVSFDGDLGIDLSVPANDLAQSTDLAPDLTALPVDLAGAHDLSSPTVTPILIVTRANATNNVDLTMEGANDWEHYGYMMNASNVNRKAGITPRISHSTLGTLNYYGFFPTQISWSNGTPVASANNTSDGVYITGTDNGFTWVVPADTTQRTL